MCPPATRIRGSARRSLGMVVDEAIGPEGIAIAAKFGNVIVDDDPLHLVHLPAPDRSI
jgi:hypothetical protein